jgi:ribosome biogenesis protein Nip4
MSYLFLKKDKKKQIESVLKLLKKENPELYKVTKEKLDQAEAEFIQKLVEKDPELMSKFKGFLKKKKFELIGKSEESENHKAAKNIESLIDDL